MNLAINFITQSIKMQNFEQSCEFHTEIGWKVTKFVEREVPAIQ